MKAKLEPIIQILIAHCGNNHTCRPEMWKPVEITFNLILGSTICILLYILTVPFGCHHTENHVTQREKERDTERERDCRQLEYITAPLNRQVNELHYITYIIHAV